MSELTDRVKEQLSTLNSSVDQLVSASRGLYFKIKEESNKQFEELVKTGEAQKSAETTFLKQVKEDFVAPFQDPKSSLDQMKSASVGFYVKTKGQTEKFFDELVELGASKLKKVEEAVES